MFQSNADERLGQYSVSAAGRFLNALGKRQNASLHCFPMENWASGCSGSQGFSGEPRRMHGSWMTATQLRAEPTQCVFYSSPLQNKGCLGFPLCFRPSRSAPGSSESWSHSAASKLLWMSCNPSAVGLEPGRAFKPPAMEQRAQLAFKPESLGLPALNKEIWKTQGPGSRTACCQQDWHSRTEFRDQHSLQTHLAVSSRAVSEYQQKYVQLPDSLFLRKFSHLPQKEKCLQKLIFSTTTVSKQTQNLHHFNGPCMNLHGDKCQQCIHALCKVMFQTPICPRTRYSHIVHMSWCQHCTLVRKGPHLPEIQNKGKNCCWSGDIWDLLNVLEQTLLG